jgi:hypothetical protein
VNNPVASSCKAATSTIGLRSGKVNPKQQELSWLTEA